MEAGAGYLRYNHCMPRRLSPVGIFFKWVVLPAASVALGYFVVAPLFEYKAKTHDDLDEAPPAASVPAPDLSQGNRQPEMEVSVRENKPKPKPASRRSKPKPKPEKPKPEEVKIVPDEASNPDMEEGEEPPTDDPASATEP